MTDIIINGDSTVKDVPAVAEPSDITVAEPSALTVSEPSEAVPYKKSKKKKEKKPRALVITSLVFTSLSLACALIGLVPFQILFIALGLLFYIIDRVKNGKRGVSLFGMICTLVTFVIIGITLFYCVILLCVGIYTVYINPEPYNFVMGTLKGFVSWFLGLFGINFSF
ncbi:MAG: hypothetical protein IJC80_01645 [Clostridia bacterium]|nr:hypothetical protein [Clostridia bacterium]